MNKLAVPETPRLSQFELLHSGKVRDIYEIDKYYLLIVTSDKISAFDVVLPSLIPGKGIVLNQTTLIWNDKFKDIIPNHDVRMPVKDFLGGRGVSEKDLDYFVPRSMIVKRLKPLPIEAIVRGYLIGSGWKDYQSTGNVCGHILPKGLQQAEKLPQILYTPSTKATIGEHDENINFLATVDLIGESIANQVRDVSIQLYSVAHDLLKQKGVILADTKFEFGLDCAGKLYLIDEVVTPDSSRFWPADKYSAGISPPSFDKQYIRDYFAELGWTGEGNSPALTEEVKSGTVDRYISALTIIQSL